MPKLEASPSSNAGSLVVGFGLVVAMFALASLAAANGMDAMRQTLKEVKAEEGRVRTVLQLASAVRDQYAHQAHMILLGDDSHMAMYQAARDRVRSLTRYLAEHTTNPVVLTRLDRIERASVELDRRFEEAILPPILRGDTRSARDAHDEALSLVLRIAEEADALVAQFEHGIAWHEQEALEKQAAASRLALGLLGGATVFAVLVGVAVGRFITLRHQAQLLEQERLASAGRIAAGVAHEINNPLAVILGYAKMLARRYPEASELPIIEAEILRCKEIVGGLLDLTRPWKSREGVVDLRATAEEVATRLADGRSDPAPPVAVRGEGRAQGNPRAIRQVLWNLMDNALTAARSKVVVNVETRGDRVRVSVEDDGGGFDGEAAERLFEPFFTTKEDGTGLGLAVSQAILRAHATTLHAENGPEGARFSFELQAAPGHP